MTCSISSSILITRHPKALPLFIQAQAPSNLLSIHPAKACFCPPDISGYQVCTRLPPSRPPDGTFLTSPSPISENILCVCFLTQRPVPCPPQWTGHARAIPWKPQYRHFAFARMRRNVSTASRHLPTVPLQENIPDPPMPHIGSLPVAPLLAHKSVSILPICPDGLCRIA